MRKAVTAIVLAIALAACAITGTVLGNSPEAQIKTGADSLKATIVVAGTLLKNDVITVTQAKSYRGMMGSASDLLDDSFKKLEACRKSTGSTSRTAPDPCAATVSGDIELALSTASKVKGLLDARQK